MSSGTARSCFQCRTAKVKCDLARPVCGRCEKRGTPCDGYLAEGSVRFRHENERAQRLSRRARGETLHSTSSPEAADEVVSVEGSTIDALEGNAIALRARFSWLNARGLAALPTQLRLDPEAHAVDFFFANWVVHPNEVSPGYMHHLPLLYVTAMPDSILRSTVRALAFADVRRTSNGGRDYKVKALQSYGAAITQLRAVAREPSGLQRDEVLAALLLIDAFETMYMGRNEPLGLHSQALEYMLEAGGDEQLYSSQRFCLTRIAIYRLQARQLLIGQDGGAFLQTLLDSLNQDRPDLQIIYNVSRIQSLCAEANHLARHGEQEYGDEASARLDGLLDQMQDLTTAVEAWPSTIAATLRPTTDLTDVTDRLRQMTVADGYHPLKHFTCPAMLKHHDTSVAFLWSFYAGAQIILRDTTIRILQLAASRSPDNAQRYLDQTHWQRLAIEALSSTIIRSVPKSMGFETMRWVDDRPSDQPSPASSLGRFLGVFALMVVEKTEATSQAHRTFAGEILACMHRSSFGERVDSR